jgi:hypothetical protein
MVKLLMSWNIQSGYEDESLEFIWRDLGPSLAALGIRITDAWYTYYGDHPQILIGGVAESLERMQGILSSDEWRRLREKLLAHVSDYKQKIVHASGGFQL